MHTTHNHANQCRQKKLPRLHRLTDPTHQCCRVGSSLVVQAQLPLYDGDSVKPLIHGGNEVSLSCLGHLKLLVEGLPDETTLLLQQHCLAHLAGGAVQLHAAVQQPTATPVQHRLHFCSAESRQLV